MTMKYRKPGSQIAFANLNRAPKAKRMLHVTTAFFATLMLCAGNLLAANIGLSCKITTETKDAGKLKTIAINGQKAPQGEITSFQQYIISDGQLLVKIDSSKRMNTVFDFNQETIVSSDYLTKLYSQVPLYYVVHYRISEFQNRKGLSGILQAGGVDGAFGSLFSRESLFGIEDEKDFLKPDIKIKENKKKRTVDYVHKKNVVSIEYSDVAINAANRAMFEKFLVYHFYLHPVIIRDMVSYGYLPKYIEYSYENMMTETHVKMEISTFNPDKDALQNLTDYSKMLADTSTYNEVLKGNFVWIDKQQCLARANDLIKQTKYLDALLTLMEYLLQSGDKPTEAIQQAITYADKDPNMQVFLRCIQSKIPNDEKVSLLLTIPQYKYEKGYLINIFLANFSDKNAQKAFEYFQKAIAKNPNITGVFKDLGELYGSKYDMENEWKCFDIALHINPRHSMSQGIQGLKAKLREDFPLYFVAGN